MKNFFAKIKEKYFMGLHGKIMKIVLILSGIMVVLFVGVTLTLLHVLCKLLHGLLTRLMMNSGL